MSKERKGRIEASAKKERVIWGEREEKIKCKVIFTSCLFNCEIVERPMPFVSALLSAGLKNVLFNDAMLLLLFTRDASAGWGFTDAADNNEEDAFCNDDDCCW